MGLTKLFVDVACSGLWSQLQKNNHRHVCGVSIATGQRGGAERAGITPQYPSVGGGMCQGIMLRLGVIPLDSNQSKGSRYVEIAPP